jgi:transglutaminase-like putative cysteine protease
MKARLALTLFVCTAALSGGLRASTPLQPSPKARRFTFTYRTMVRDLPANAALVRIWIPLATSNSSQSVSLKKVTSPVRLRETREETFGDKMMYAELHHPHSPTAEFTLAYEVTRREYSRGDYQSLMQFDRAGGRPPASVQRFLLPDLLVPVGGQIQQLAEESTRGHQGVVDRAHALYDYVFHTLRYDKSGTGWGRGDALWVCDAKHGNCTDFHSLFIALARSEKIPARFEIGFPLPRDAHQGTIPGYHCWAEFYVNGPGWVPVDISEAWQDPAKHDYFFGTLDANRVGFTLGRDLTLSPRQDGPPLNYFVYPYVEVDGKPFDNIDKQFSFQDLGANALAAAGHSGPVP